MIGSLRNNIFRTFRGKLALLYISVEFVILLLSAMVLYALLSRQVYTELDNSMLGQGQLLVAGLQSSPNEFWLAQLTHFSRDFNGVVQLVSVEGDSQFIWRYDILALKDSGIHHAYQRALEGEVASFISTSSLLRKENIRVLAVPVHRGNQVVSVLLLARSTMQIQAFFTLLFWIGGILGLVSIIISAWAGYAMALRALRPIKEINHTARAVASGDLSRRLTSRASDTEISDLVSSLNQMFQSLEDNFVAQKHFTADASHELRIPLTILKGEIEVSLRKSRSTEEYQQLLKQNLTTIERMHRLVDDLLTLARSDAGQLELEQEQVDFSLLLEEVYQHHLILYSQKGLHIDVDIQDELQVIGDSEALERVIYNLLNNAYKHGPAGSTVYIRAHAEIDRVCVTVRDQGPGIAPEHQQHLFNRFYRSDDARDRQQGGVGLGLAICKKIVDSHGGDIGVESTLGEGAEFIIKLPLSKANPGLQQRLDHVINFRP